MSDTSLRWLWAFSREATKCLCPPGSKVHSQAGRPLEAQSRSLGYFEGKQKFRI